MKARRILTVALALVLVFMGCATLSAQSKGTLTVQCNVSGSQVYLDGRLVGNATPTFSFSLPVRSYSLKVTHAGYQDFNTTINVTTAGVMIQANLIPVGQAAPAPAPAPAPSTGMIGGKYTLTVTCNVPQAGVLVNGAMVGKVPYTGQYVPGTYKVTVRWAGYKDFEQTVQLNSNITVNAILGQAPPPPPAQYPLTVNANVPHAAVFINGNQVGTTPYTAQLTAGTYAVTVRVPGYNDFNQSVMVNGPSQVNATLMPQQASLTVNANVQGAEVFLNGSPAGRTPLTLQVVPGSYTVTVRAPGYNDFSQNVVVNGPIQVNAMLQGTSWQLTVDSSPVRGAQVLINGSAVGQTPYQSVLPAGVYSLVVRAPGFADFNYQFSMNGPQNINAQLSPMAASWQISLPDNIVNKDMKGGHWSQIMIYLDGVLQKGSSGQILPGRHVIRITSGGVASETVFDVQAGRTYVFEPFFGITVK